MSGQKIYQRLNSQREKFITAVNFRFVKKSIKVLVFVVRTTHQLYNVQYVLLCITPVWLKFDRVMRTRKIQLVTKSASAAVLSRVADHTAVVLAATKKLLGRRWLHERSEVTYGAGYEWVANSSTVTSTVAARFYGWISPSHRERCLLVCRHSMLKKQKLRRNVR